MGINLSSNTEPLPQAAENSEGVVGSEWNPAPRVQLTSVPIHSNEDGLPRCGRRRSLQDRSTGALGRGTQRGGAPGRDTHRTSTKWEGTWAGVLPSQGGQAPSLLAGTRTEAVGHPRGSRLRKWPGASAERGSGAEVT